MKTDKITVFDLFEKQRRYLVPVFQRGYVWTPWHYTNYKLTGLSAGVGPSAVIQDVN